MAFFSIKDLRQGVSKDHEKLKQGNQINLLVKLAYMCNAYLTANLIISNN